MSNYVRQNDFSIKDALPSGSAQKIIRGTDVDAEFDAIVPAIASKMDNISGGGATGNVPLISANGTTLTDSGYSYHVLESVINVKDYGATGDSATDDTTALNAAYTAARAAGNRVVVYWPPGTYITTGRIDATGVSTRGDNTTLSATVAAGTDTAAFQWGGDDTFVTGMRFILANTVTGTPMQGIYNAVNDADRQRFYANYVECTTISAFGDFGTMRGNIYGLWCSGTGLTNLFVQNNVFKDCSYGFQLNNQDSSPRDVNTNPLGNPTYGVVVTGNVLIGCPIGINTPHIMCYGVTIANNIVRTGTCVIRMPINVSHVTGLTITGNILTGDVPFDNGILHIEDCAQQSTISNNTIDVTVDNCAIYIDADPADSQDNDPTHKFSITGNTVRGYGTGGTKAGIKLRNTTAADYIVSGNHISNFVIGIITEADNSAISNNMILDCAIGVSTSITNQVFEGNVFKGCTSIAQNASTGCVIISGGTIVADSFSFTKDGAYGVFLVNNLLFRRVTPTTFSDGVPFDVCPCPDTYQFTGEITIVFQYMGFSKHTFTFNGTTFTPTRTASYPAATVSSLTLSKSGTTIQATATSASGTASMAMLISGMVY